MEKTYSFQKLADFVWGFAIKHRLFGLGSELAIGLSGGADSRLLLELAHFWREQGKIAGLRALHFNHQLRAASAYEEDFVKKLAASLDVELVLGELVALKPVKSELELRTHRYQFFKTHLSAGEVLLLGHHLDDSFEWSLRQQARSSRPEAILGMPVLSGLIRRPLMCLSRAQIEYGVEIFGLEHCHDESNFDLHYERNFIRHQVVAALKKVSPSLLKNYVARSNELAKRFGLTPSSRAQPDGLYQIERWQGYPVIHLTWSGDFLSGPCESTVRECLELLSTKKRGMWREQIHKLCQSVQKKWAGPFSFSGGVRALVTPGRVTFYAQSFEMTLARLVASGAQAEARWLYQIDFNDRAIKRSDFPKIPSSHILAKWFGNSQNGRLITHEQVLRLGPRELRALEITPHL